MRWTQQEYDAYLAKRSAVGVKLSPAESQQDQAPALVQAVSRETKSIRRPVVRFTFYCLRLRDRDNYTSSPKDLCDGLRHASLIPGDSEAEIDLQVEQVKIAHRSEQRTVIEIIYPAT